MSFKHRYILSGWGPVDKLLKKRCEKGYLYALLTEDLGPDYLELHRAIETLFTDWADHYPEHKTWSVRDLSPRELEGLNNED